LIAVSPSKQIAVEVIKESKMIVYVYVTCCFIPSAVIDHFLKCTKERCQ